MFKNILQKNGVNVGCDAVYAVYCEQASVILEIKNVSIFFREKELNILTNLHLSF